MGATGATINNSINTTINRTTTTTPQARQVPQTLQPLRPQQHQLNAPHLHLHQLSQQPSQKARPPGSVSGCTLAPLTPDYSSLVGLVRRLATNMLAWTDTRGSRVEE